MNINRDQNKIDDFNDSFYNEIDPAILEDPIQLLKWFESHGEITTPTYTQEDPPKKAAKKVACAPKNGKVATKHSSLLDDLLCADDCQTQEAMSSEVCCYSDWLIQKVGIKAKEELFTAYEEIERLALKYGYIHSPLLHILDVKTIRNLQSLLVQKREFRMLDLNFRYTCGLALRHYTQYLTEQSNIDIDQNQGSGLPSATDERPGNLSTSTSTPNARSSKAAPDFHTNSIQFSENVEIKLSNRSYADSNSQPISELIIKDLNSIKDALTQYFSHINDVGNPIIVEAYRAYLTEKLKRSPEQAISEAFKHLLFIVKSGETYSTLANYAQYLSEQKLVSSDISESTNADDNLAEMSGNLSQQGITPGWLYMHGLNTIASEGPSTQLVDVSTINYKKVKKGIRIDSVKSSGRILIPDFIEGLPVIKIGASAFKRRKDITTVILPKHLLEIEENAFEQSGIISIIIPDSVEQIGRCAFRDCKKLTSISLPQLLKTIKWSTFSGCSSLKAIQIPCNVTTICDSAFSGCTKLKHVQVPDTVTRFESYVFSSKPVLYCHNGSRAFRYAEEWYLPKPRAFEDYDIV